MPHAGDPVDETGSGVQRAAKTSVPRLHPRQTPGRYENNDPQQLPAALSAAGPQLSKLLDPIVALATASGRGAVGIVRISGPQLQPLVRALCGRELQPRHASFGSFLDAAGQPIDQGLAIHFPAPRSYTGEDVLELQAHGGPVVLQLLLARCLEAGAAIGLRLAEPGEFTLRAFLNGKLDLAQAEAVADLIDASTEAAARSASRSLAGAFSCEVGRWVEQLVGLRTLVEATLDFPEEEVDFLEQARAKERLEGLAIGLDALLAQARQGALLREGLRVVLAGQPNVGKSSLLNALAGAELAIVTAIPGTTRDRISETIQIHGVPLHVTDTAGLRELGSTGDEVERIGVQRSWAAIGEADTVLFLHDLTRIGDGVYDAGDARILAQLHESPLAGDAAEARLLHVYNKLDAAPQALPPGAIGLSARTGAGIETLRETLVRRAGWQPGGEGSFIARARHVQALHEAAAHLAVARGLLAEAAPALELLAEELRLAHQALGAITGSFTADDLLGHIFARFCIGK